MPRLAWLKHHRHGKKCSEGYGQRSDPQPNTVEQLLFGNPAAHCGTNVWMPAAACRCGCRTSTQCRALEQTQTASFELRAIGVLAMAAIWRVLNRAVNSFLAHEALSRGAAIAFYVVTSLAPVLLIVVAIAGVVFGPDAVRGSLVKELSGVFGQQGGELIQTMLARSSDKSSSAVVSIFGALMVTVTASGVFNEMQTGLNRAWDVKPIHQPWLSLVRTRAASLGLVAALGFLLMVSLAASTGLAALGHYLGARSAFAPLFLSVLNTVVSIALFTVLFAAIFKVLPDTAIAWRDVIIGAFVTAVLFTIGKSLIGWYLGTTAASSGYGAAGALILILLWSYYSAQILLFGAELTRAMAPPQPDDEQGKTSESEPSSPSLQPHDTDTWQPHRFKRNI